MTQTWHMTCFRLQICLNSVLVLVSCISYQIRYLYLYAAGVAAGQQHSCSDHILSLHNNDTMSQLMSSAGFKLISQNVKKDLCRTRIWKSSDLTLNTNCILDTPSIYRIRCLFSWTEVVLYPYRSRTLPFLGHLQNTGWASSFMMINLKQSK